MLNENRVRSKIVKLNELYNINKFQLALRYKEMELKKISEQIGRRKSRNLFLKVRHKGPSLDSDIINRVKNIKKLKIIGLKKNILLKKFVIVLLYLKNILKNKKIKKNIKFLKLMKTI